MWSLFESDARSVPTVIVGGLQCLVAVAMCLKQWWAHRELQRRTEVDEQTYTHIERQIHRRLAMSGLFFSTGVVIALWPRLEDVLQKTAQSYVAASSLVLGVVMVLIAAFTVLGIVDVVATAAHTRRISGELRGGRQQLEEELRSIIARHRRDSKQEDTR